MMSLNLDNWFYDDISDTYTHPDGWDYHFDYINHSRTTTGFEQEIRVYKADYPELLCQPEISRIKAKRESSAFI
ncbi:hypothetical protein STPL106120_10900 [Streptococcus pluranimalium]